MTGAAAPLPRRLLPDTAEVDATGGLVIGGVPVAELSARFGTPLFVYDEDHLRARCREAVRAWGDGVAYATKAFLCRAMASLAHEEGMQLDVATGGELHVALASGVPAGRIVLHGNNKSEAELEMGLRAGVGRIVVDSFDEIERLTRLAPALGVVPKVLLRCTPGVEAHTHEYVATGQDDSKFGLTVSTGAASEAVALLRAPGSGVDLVGLHAHIGSNVFLASSYAKAATVLAEMAIPLDLPELVVGGGLGVAYVADEEAPTITEWAESALDALREAGLPSHVRVGAEPGRAIVAAAAVTVYQVGTIKRLPGIRTYVAVDGGMSDNPRPVLYGSGYEAFLPRAVDAPRPLVAHVVGKHCESGDLLVRDAHLPEDLTVGDLLATPVTGAYGHSMGSSYNKVLRPPVVFVGAGRARVVVRREGYDDLLTLDLG